MSVSSQAILHVSAACACGTQQLSTQRFGGRYLRRVPKGQLGRVGVAHHLVKTLSKPCTSGVCQVRREHGYSAATMPAADGADGVDGMVKCDLLST